MEHTLSREQSRRVLKALADPIRLDVIDALAEGERCVCDLTSDLNLAQSKLSFHLKVLHDAGLLSDRKKGRWVYYRLNADTIIELQNWLGSLALRCHHPASERHCFDATITNTEQIGEQSSRAIV